MIARYADRLQDYLAEFVYGIHTRGEQNVDEASASFKDANPYQYLSYSLIYRVMHRIDRKPQKRFVDYGCGKGRVVCAAARYPFAAVTGIELDRNLAMIAKRNSDRLRGRQCSIEILLADAVSVHPKHGDVFFFYNPFGVETMKRVLAQIAAEWKEYPRDIQIVYVNPLEAELLEQQSWLKRNDSLSFELARHHGLRFPHVFYYDSVSS